MQRVLWLCVKPNLPAETLPSPKTWVGGFVLPTHLWYTVDIKSVQKGCVMKRYNHEEIANRAIEIIEESGYDNLFNKLQKEFGCDYEVVKKSLVEFDVKTPRSIKKKDRDPIILKMFKDGKTREEIAEYFGVKKQVVDKSLRAQGVKLKRDVTKNNNPNSKPELRKHRVNYIKKELSEGKKSTEIANELGISYSYLRKIINDEGISTPLPKKVHPNRENLINESKALYEAGFSAARIGEVLGIAHTTVSKWAEECGWEVTSKNDLRTKSPFEDIASDEVFLQKFEELKEYSELLGQHIVPATKMAEALGVKNVKNVKQRMLDLGIYTPRVLINKERMKVLYEHTKSVAEVSRLENIRYEKVCEVLLHEGVIDYRDTSSHMENDLRFVVEKLSGTKFPQNRTAIKPFEIDLYSKDHKFGIEFNGCYWHSTRYLEEDGQLVHDSSSKKPDYHQKKSLLAQENGIFLFHVFEHQWLDDRQRSALVSQIKNLVGENNRKIYARKTKIVNIPRDMEYQFLQDNHVQGHIDSSVCYGLEHNGELVSLMSFRKHQKYGWELSRFCSLAGSTVVGGASKLFKHFIRENNPDQVLSFADIARTKGNIYSKLGFDFVSITPPNYWWYNPETLEVKTRYQTQMKNENLIMTRKGFVKMYDCGSRKFVWSKK